MEDAIAAMLSTSHAFKLLVIIVWMVPVYSLVFFKFGVG